MYFRLTLFNGITLFVLGLTIWVLIARFRSRPESNWFLLYYAVLLGFWKAFGGSLAAPWVLTGVAAAVIQRFRFVDKFALTIVRAVEVIVLVYVMWRCVALLLMLPW